MNTKLLNRGKQSLIDHAVQIYTDRREFLSFDEYETHFQGLGSIIAFIDKIESFSELIKKLENGDFEVLGLFPSDEDMMENFLNDINE